MVLSSLDEGPVTTSNADLLAVVVRAAEEDEGGIPPEAIADRLGIDATTCRIRLETLVDCGLVARAEDGYRPTVTGRELLQLGLTDDIVVVDPSGEVE